MCRFLANMTLVSLSLSTQTGYLLLKGSDETNVVGVFRDITNGSPIAGVHIACGNSTAISSIDGRFKVLKEKGAACRLKISVEGFFQDPKSNLLIDDDAETNSKEIILNLIPAAKLSGSVRTRERQAIEGATIYLLSTRRSSKARSFYSKKTATTAKDGSFLFENIQPGKYYLLCSPPRNPIGKTALAPTYFPYSVNDQGAVSLSLRPGERQSGLDLEVKRERVYTVSGQLLSQDRLADFSKSASLELLRRANGENATVTVDPVRSPISPPYSRILLRSDGQFKIEDVFSGSYELVLKSKIAHTTVPLSRIEVAGREVAGLKLDFIPPSRVSGRVLVQPDSEQVQKVDELPKTMFLSDPDVTDETSTLIRIEKDGSFHVGALAPGKFEVYLFSGSMQKTDSYIDSVEWNGLTQPKLSFQNAGFPDNKLIIRLRSGRATIRASAPRDASKVVLFPVPLREIDSLRGAVVIGEHGSDGSYLLPRIIPGNYYICAVDSFDGGNFLEWVNETENAKNLEKHCKRIDVKSKDRLSLTLPLLPFSSGKF